MNKTIYYFAGIFITLGLALGLFAILAFKDACYWHPVGTNLDQTLLMRNSCTGAVR